MGSLKDDHRRLVNIAASVASGPNKMHINQIWISCLTSPKCRLLRCNYSIIFKNARVIIEME